MSMRPTARTRRLVLGSVLVMVVVGANVPALYAFSTEKYHAYRIGQPEYKARNGAWSAVDVPSGHRINAIHAALLHTGKVLLVAGSGNNAKNFAARSFRTVLWDPERNSYKEIPTPKDLFCAGHSQLPDGKLLVAGGTQRYEKLNGDVRKAGGLMVVHNENPDAPKTLPAGTRFTGRDNGRTFVSTTSVLIPRAKKRVRRVGPPGEPGERTKVEVTGSVARVYVEAEREGRAYQTGTEDNYRIGGLKGQERRDVYGIAQKLSFDKKDFQGIRDAYEFDPLAERYLRVDPMREARWYPTLTTLADGSVLSVSGLDEIGQVVPGKNEIYDPRTKTWRYLPKKRFFPTYPALFLTGKGRIFYTGSNAGYGPADVGRDPGVWDLRSNTFTKVPGLRDPEALETSMSVLLPPAQRQRYMVLGGGGVGESKRVTARTDLVDLRAARPRFTKGPDLYAKVRYPSSVVLPDDTVLTTNGSGDYRGRSDSNVLRAELYDPARNTSRRVADPLVGRNYHSGALLLPDGRVMTFGSDSLFADAANSRPGTFEQRIDLWTPPYLYRGGDRPTLTGVGRARPVRLGGEVTFRRTGARPQKVRLIRPGSFTHVTNVEQRSVALPYRLHGGRVTVRIPSDPSLVPPGWYMVSAVDARGVPSKAAWIKVLASPSAPHALPPVRGSGRGQPAARKAGFGAAVPGIRPQGTPMAPELQRTGPLLGALGGQQLGAGRQVSPKG